MTGEQPNLSGLDNLYKELDRDFCGVFAVVDRGFEDNLSEFACHGLTHTRHLAW